MRIDMNIVIDTNVLVSAIMSPGRNATDIICAAIAGRFTVCYDSRILEEYERVLHYPKFGFSEWEIVSLLDPLIRNGLSVIPTPVKDPCFDKDPSDLKFYEVALFCDAILITGNLKHYPSSKTIIEVSEFVKLYM